MSKPKLPKLYYKFNNTRSLRVLKKDKFPKLADFLEANQRIIVDFFNQTRSAKPFFLSKDEFDIIALEYGYSSIEYQVLFSSTQTLCIIKQKQEENV